MRHKLLLTIASVILVSPMLRAQKPVQDDIVSSRFKAPPATISGLVDAVNAVVVVRVSGGRGITSMAASQAVLTKVVGTILDVVKPHPQIGAPGTSVTFLVVGGEVDRGDHVQRLVDKSQPSLLKRTGFVGGPIPREDVAHGTTQQVLARTT